MFAHFKDEVILDVGLSADCANILLKAIDRIYGLPDAKLYCGHGLYRGFATEVSQNGV